VRDRLGCLAILLVIGLLCACLWLGNRREKRLNANFDRVARNMSETQVIALLGKPNWRGRCGTSNYYSFVQPVKGSRDCLVYASVLAPLNPWYPVVFLGPDERVIDKYTYASP
jgi:hypothetical protein